jgi:hypothetical protein
MDEQLDRDRDLERQHEGGHPLHWAGMIAAPITAAIPSPPGGVLMDRR